MQSPALRSFSRIASPADDAHDVNKVRVAHEASRAFSVRQRCRPIRSTAKPPAYVAGSRGFLVAGAKLQGMAPARPYECSELGGIRKSKHPRY